MIRDIDQDGEFEANETFYFLKDHLNSVRELLDHTGKIYQRYTYSAYGETKIAKHDRNTNFVENRYAYTSREIDEHTGLYYYRARYYNSSTGRFLSPDPIGLRGGDTNLYRYVRNNPLRYTDPSGLVPGDPFQTESEAAVDALNYINNTSIAENIEYSGTIERDPVTGSYYATQPVGGNADTSPFNPTSNSTASYHTHAGYSPIHDNERFSPADIQGDRAYGLNGYVATPSGSIKFRTPNSNQSSNMNSPNMCGGK